MSTTTIIAGDVPTNWNDIFNKLLEGEHEFLVTDGQQVRAVIMAQAQYRQLMGLLEREARR